MYVLRISTYWEALKSSLVKKCAGYFECALKILECVFCVPKRSPSFDFKINTHYFALSFECSTMVKPITAGIYRLIGMVHRLFFHEMRTFKKNLQMISKP